MRSDALQRRQRILDAGCELLPIDGQHMTLESVAEKAGVGIATLYRNFPTRNALIYACVFQIAEQIMNTIDEAIESLQEPGTDCEQIFRDLVPLTIPSGINVLVPTLISPPEELLPEELRILKGEFTSRIDSILKVVRDQGLIHETVSDLDMVQGLISLYAKPVFDLGSEFSEKFNVDVAVDIFLKGCEMGIQDAHKPRTASN